MELYNKSDKFDIMNCDTISQDEFSNMNIITMRLYSWNKKKYYSFAFYLANIHLDDNTIDKIKLINSNIISEADNYFFFKSDVLEGIDSDQHLTLIIKQIINILFSSKYIKENTFFGISYEYNCKLYNGRLLFNSII
jgi:hypothetical protein